MAWAITKDFLASETDKPGTNANAVGKFGPRTTKLTYDEIINHPEGKRFRMRDDDGELYYEGIYCPTGDSELSPLDDYGTPNAGCTSIEYYDKGWKAI